MGNYESHTRSTIRYFRYPFSDSMDNANLLAKRAKVPVVKAKVGPRMMTMMCDPKIFDDIPLKKEIKVSASGIYINRIISVRGGKVPEPPKKKGFFSRITNR